ncbi:hypothetical protein IM538_13850 [Cytobacillus suaedae]|nr:hypothetical protein IM538_13850 [Cytobacillus suaedae]
MRVCLVLLLLLSIFISLVGCTNQSNGGQDTETNHIGELKDSAVIEKEDKLVVRIRIGEDNEYEFYKEITDREKVEKVILILEKANWKNAKVMMAHPPNYKINNKYDIWITPLKNMLEVVIPSQSQYTKLSETESAILYEMITGEQLSK